MKGRVQKLGGDIRVESTPEEGSCFSCTLEFEIESTSKMEEEHGKELARVIVISKNGFFKEAVASLLQRIKGCNNSFVDSLSEAQGVLDEHLPRSKGKVWLIVDEEIIKDSNGSSRGIDKLKDLLGHYDDLSILVLVRDMNSVQTWDMDNIHLLEKSSMNGSLLNILLSKGKEASETGWPDAPLEKWDDTGDQLNGLNVLLVEDNPVNQELCMTVLSTLGCDVILAENGKEALDILNTKEFDIILMDCQMPVLDGYETTRRLRRMEKEAGKPKVPVIALTAYAMEGDKNKCIASGMDDYIAKPFKLKELADKLRKWQKDGAAGKGTSNKPVRSGQDPTPDTCSIPTGESAGSVDFSVIDELRMLERRSGRKFFSKSVAKFLKNSKEYIEAMKIAVTKGDKESLRFHAHTLKGTSGFMGANQLSALCLELEKMARNGNVGDADKLIERIVSEYQRVKLVLEEFLE